MDRLASRRTMNSAQRFDRTYEGLAIAIAGPLVVTGVLLLVDDPWTYYPGLLYLGAIVLAGLFGSRLAAALALTVSVVALWTIVTSPRFTLDMTLPQAAGVLVVFLPVGSAIVRLVMQRETERELAQRQKARAEVLGQLAASLSGALTTQQIAAQMLDAIVDQFGATAGAVGMMDGGIVSCLEVRGLHSSRSRELMEERLHVPETVRDAFDDGRMIFTERGLETYVAGGAGSVDRARPTSAGAWVHAPISANGAVIGVVLLHLSETTAPDEAEFLLLHASTMLAGTAFVRAARFAEERDRAVLLQRELLPKGLPKVSGLEFASCYQPAEALVGGDWYDAFVVERGLVVLSLGDVAGHGLRAAAATLQIRNSIRILASEGHAPGAVLDRVNRSMNDQRDDMWLTTAIVLLLDPASGNFLWARAGHCLPVLFRADSNACELRSEAGGPPLGIGLGHSYDEARGELRRGDVLALYSDGMIERRRETLAIGEQRVMSALATRAENERSIDDVLGAVVADCLDPQSPRRDDVCALLVRRGLSTPCVEPAAPRQMHRSTVVGREIAFR